MPTQLRSDYGGFLNPIVTDQQSLTAGVAQILFNSRTRFPKPVEEYDLLRFFGNNILTTEFEEWKRYRKIAAPAFSEVCGDR